MALLVALFVILPALALGACASLYGEDEPAPVVRDAAPDVDGADAQGSADAPSATGDASADADAVPELLAYWKFDEASGTQAIDDSNHGRHATIVGAVKREQGRYGGGLTFTRGDAGDGTGELNCQNLAATLVRPTGTLLFWWRDDDDTPAPLAKSVGVFDIQSSLRDHFFVTRFKDAPAHAFTLGFQFAAPDAAAIDDFANGTGGTIFSLAKGEWTRIVVSWTTAGATVRFGSAVETFTFYRAWAPTAPGCVFGRHARGALDEVRFYDRPLSADQITALP